MPQLLNLDPVGDGVHERATSSSYLEWVHPDELPVVRDCLLRIVTGDNPAEPREGDNGPPCNNFRALSTRSSERRVIDPNLPHGLPMTDKGPRALQHAMAILLGPAIQPSPVPDTTPLAAHRLG